jgi:uncharacterized protein YlaI
MAREAQRGINMKGKCDRCKQVKEGVEYTVDPYHEYMYNESIEYYLCPECLTILENEIEGGRGEHPE